MSAAISESQLEQENKRKEQRRERDGGLLSDLSDVIISRFTCSGDKVRFAAVCASWRLAAAKLRRGRRPSHPPWLMLPGPEGKGDEHRSLYSVSESKLYHVHLPQMKGQRCVGSGQGWIVTVNNLTGELQLVDLVSGGTTHRLPSITSFSDVGDAPVLDQQGRLKGYMCRSEGRLTSGPGVVGRTDTEFGFTHVSYMHSLYRKVIFFPTASLLFVFFNSPTVLAFARLGEESWKEFEFEFDEKDWSITSCLRSTDRIERGGGGSWLDSCYSFSDLVFHKGQFYVTVTPGWILALQLDDSTPPRCTHVVLRPPPDNDMKDVVESYLVESPDGTELMQVQRHAPYTYKTNSFTVFKCSNISNGTGGQEVEAANWEEVKCLGEWVLFLGMNFSLALSTNDFPELMPNSIYFTRPRDAPVGYPNDMGVFHLESRTIEPLFFMSSQFSRMTVPFWIPHTEYFPSQFAKVEEMAKRSTIKNGDEKDQLVWDETNENGTCHSTTPDSFVRCFAQKWRYQHPIGILDNPRSSGKLRGTPRI